MKGKRTGDSEAALWTAGVVRLELEAGRRGLTLLLHTHTVQQTVSDNAARNSHLSSLTTLHVTAI